MAQKVEMTKTPATMAESNPKTTSAVAFCSELEELYEKDSIHHDAIRAPSICTNFNRRAVSHLERLGVDASVGTGAFMSGKPTVGRERYLLNSTMRGT